MFTGLLFCAGCAFVWYAAYLLGRRAEVQPFKYAFGGEPEPRDYGRTLADGALLILLACFGLAERGHETTPQLAQFVGAAGAAGLGRARHRHSGQGPGGARRGGGYHPCLVRL